MRRLLVLVLFVGACSSQSSSTATAHRTTTTRAITTTQPTTTTSPPVTFSPLCHPDTYLPCQRLTPGSLNPAVTQATIHQTICVKGWTTTIRPPVTVTNALKLQAAAAYGYTHFQPANYEGDHLISLELGGNPEGRGDRDISNFWDEPHTINGRDGKPAGSGVKDRWENALRAKVCAGSMTLAQAQQQIRGDWYSAYVAAGRP